MKIIKNEDYTKISCGDFPYCDCNKELYEKRKLNEEITRNYYGCFYIERVFCKSENEDVNSFIRNYEIEEIYGWEDLYSSIDNVKEIEAHFKEKNYFIFKHLVVPRYILTETGDEYGHVVDDINETALADGEYGSGGTTKYWGIINTDNPKVKILCAVRIYLSK